MARYSTFSVKLQGNRLEQHFKAKDGDRTNTYTLGDDGASPRLDVIITSSQLPKPVEYVLNYRRGG